MKGPQTEMWAGLRGPVRAVKALGVIKAGRGTTLRSEGPERRWRCYQNPAGMWS